MFGALYDRRECLLKYFPVCLDIKGQTCLVVGGGEVGRRKVATLLDCGAQVRLVGPDLHPELAAWIANGQVVHAGPDYLTEMLDGLSLVFAATDDSELNARISHDCAERGIWVNVVDQPQQGRFIVPASLQRGDLTIAVSTSGSSPAMAARIKARLEAQFGSEYADFLRLMALVRERILAQGRPPRENRRLFRQLVASDLLQLLARKDLDGVEQILVDIIGPEYTPASLNFHLDSESPV